MVQDKYYSTACILSCIKSDCHRFIFIKKLHKLLIAVLRILTDALIGWGRGVLYSDICVLPVRLISCEKRVVVEIDFKTLVGQNN